MNIELLRKIQAHILEDPARFIMDHVYTRSDPGCRIRLAWELEREVPACGTIACIAGWAVVLADSKDPVIGMGEYAIMDRAEIVLGLGTLQAKRLFLLVYWPNKFYKPWRKSSSLEERAHIASDRIDHFIATNGLE